MAPRLTVALMEKSREKGLTSLMADGKTYIQ
jgi:hypothetical protein